MRWLEQADPEVAKAIRLETERQSRNLELIASENFVSEAVLEAVGSVMTNKYAEGYPGRRYYGGCEHVDTVEELAIQRAKELFGAEHVNVQPHSGSQANMAVYFTVLAARRHDRRPEPGARRPPHDGQPRELLRQALPGGAVRRPARGRADRPRPGARPLPGASPEAARRRRVGLSEGDRLQALPRDRRRVRVSPDGRHRASGWAGRGGTPPDADPPRRLRDDDHAQDAPGAAGRHGHVPGRARPGARQGRDARHAGRAADARDRREGGRVPRGADARLARVPAADRRQREGAGRRADAARPPARDGRHGHPPHAGRPHGDGAHRQGGAGGARPGLDHREQEHDPLRDAEPDGDERDPRRHAGGHHAGHEGARDGRHRGASSTASSGRRGTRRPRPRCGWTSPSLAGRFPLYPERLA